MTIHFGRIYYCFLTKHFKPRRKVNRIPLFHQSSFVMKSEEKLIERVEDKVAHSDIRGAVRLLISNDYTLSERQKKHPTAL